jgi:hypothetical protein
MKQEVWIAIPAVYNAGEWRLSKQVIGPRGGKKWVRLTHGIAATGGHQQMFLEPGVYKETWWANGWPSCSIWELDENGEINDDVSN